MAVSSCAFHLSLRFFLRLRSRRRPQQLLVGTAAHSSERNVADAPQRVSDAWLCSAQSLCHGTLCVLLEHGPLSCLSLLTVRSAPISPIRLCVRCTTSMRRSRTAGMARSLRATVLSLLLCCLALHSTLTRGATAAPLPQHRRDPRSRSPSCCCSRPLCSTRVPQLNLRDCPPFQPRRSLMRQQAALLPLR